MMKKIERESRNNHMEWTKVMTWVRVRAWIKVMSWVKVVSWVRVRLWYGLRLWWLWHGSGLRPIEVGRVKCHAHDQHVGL